MARPRARLMPAAGVGLATAGAAAYWTTMSPRSQLLGPFPYAADTAEKVVALTFDDGPNEPYTGAVADLLGARGIRATFFQVGACVQRWPASTARLAADGHLVGNHSWSHRFDRCLRVGVMRDEVRRTQDVIEAATGSRPTLYRPPWLLRTPRLLAMLAAEGLDVRSGEFCHPLEPLQPAAARIARRVLLSVRPGRVIIFHDGFDARGGDRAHTVEAVRLVVDQLCGEGWRFATLDEPPFTDGAGRGRRAARRETISGGDPPGES